jgi:hypothetical protein
MLNRARALVGTDASPLRVLLDETMYVGSLRYFESNGRFANAAQEVLATTLPRTLKVTIRPSEGRQSLIALAWRSPTETLLLTDSESCFEQIETLSVSDQDGCFVDQTQGLCVLRAAGVQLLGLFQRMGGNDLFPLLGEAKRGRLADVPVLALMVQQKEILLVVERIYLEYVMDWIKSVVQDLDMAAAPSP